jgi:glyoxylase-like metal-dependent hydrolase (beta-lactamase superfamily II)
MKHILAGRFGHQLPRLGLFNAYLVQEQDGLTLIDTAMSAAPQILAAAKALNLGPIRRILLTHAHGDHIGSLDALCQPHASKAAHIGGAVGSPPEVAISKREARLMSKPPDKSLEPDETQCKVKGSLPGAQTQPTHRVDDGELYGSLRCIATPGHTPGHFSFLDERDGTLYAGDALVTMGGSCHIAGWAPWFFPLPNFATWHRPTAKASIERLLTLPLPTSITRIAAGHGRLIEGGVNAIQQALSEARL